LALEVYISFGTRHLNFTPRETDLVLGLVLTVEQVLSLEVGNEAWQTFLLQLILSSSSPLTQTNQCHPLNESL
jgi:hypothetical protein